MIRIDEAAHEAAEHVPEPLRAGRTGPRADRYRREVVDPRGDERAHGSLRREPQRLRAERVERPEPGQRDDVAAQRMPSRRHERDPADMAGEHAPLGQLRDRPAHRRIDFGCRPLRRHLRVVAEHIRAGRHVEHAAVDQRDVEAMLRTPADHDALRALWQ